VKRRLKPTEVRLVEEVLLDPEEDATVIARRVLYAINDHRERERLYVVLLWDEETHKFLSAWGPYTSIKAADADLRIGGVLPSRKSTATLVGLVASDTEEENA